MKSIYEFVSDYVHNPHEIVDWNEYLEQAGYFCVVIDGRYTRTELRERSDWIKERCGPDHCYWTGHRFWFDREEDAVLFALKWA